MRPSPSGEPRAMGTPVRADVEAMRRRVRWRGGSLAAVAGILAAFLLAEFRLSLAAPIAAAEVVLVVIGLLAAVTGRSFVPAAALLALAWANWLVVLGFYSLLVLAH